MSLQNKRIGIVRKKMRNGVIEKIDYKAVVSEYSLRKRRDSGITKTPIRTVTTDVGVDSVVVDESVGNSAGEIETETLRLYHGDAVTFIKTIPDASIQCIICDPPFGLGEDPFDKHYARDLGNILEGYQTAPQDSKLYEEWAKLWIHEIPRILKPDGTLYIVCAWNHVCDIELAIRSAPSPFLTVVNHIIWKYNFGVYTQKKFVSSHYHILRCAVGNNTPAFYNRAFFSETDKTLDGHNAQYSDMEDVWIIPKEFSHGTIKNVNKLPDALVRKRFYIRLNQKIGLPIFFLEISPRHILREERDASLLVVRSTNMPTTNMPNPRERFHPGPPTLHHAQMPDGMIASTHGGVFLFRWQHGSSVT